jgi:hypothetical protein
MRKISLVLVLYLLLILNVKLVAQIIIYQGANIHTGTGRVINNGVLAVEKEKIIFVGSQNDFKSYATHSTSINLSGKEIYPSIISLYTNIGLTEIEAVRATRDDTEIGNLNSNIHTYLAYNTESEVLSTLRSNGILLAQVTPRGNLIAGNSSIMTLFGNSWEEALYITNDGIHLNFPSLYNSGTNKDNYYKEIEKIKSFFENAKLYNEKPTSNEKNLRLENLVGLFSGSKTLYINVSFTKDIITAVNLAKKLGIVKIVIVGAEHGIEALDFLKVNQIPIILKRLFSLPNHTESNLFENLQMPKLLKQKGILFAFSYFGADEAAYSRNISFNAGSCVSFGLSKEEALEAITYSAAKILGIEKQTGSIELGKEANFLVVDGDLLDYKTSNIEDAYFKGKKINLDNRQKKIFQSYLEKYNLKK